MVKNVGLAALLVAVGLPLAAGSAAASDGSVVQACNPHFSWCPSAGYETPHACVIAKNQMAKTYWVQPEWDDCLQASGDWYFRYSGPR